MYCVGVEVFGADRIDGRLEIEAKIEAAFRDVKRCGERLALDSYWETIEG